MLKQEQSPSAQDERMESLALALCLLVANHVKLEILLVAKKVPRTGTPYFQLEH